MKNKTLSYNERMSKRYKGKKKQKQVALSAPDYKGVTGLSRTNGLVLNNVLIKGGKRHVARVKKAYL